MKYVTIVNGVQFEVEIQNDGQLLVNGKPHIVDFLPLGSNLFSIIKDNRSLEVVVEEVENRYDVLLSGKLYETQVLDERAMLMATRRGGLQTDSGEVKSPMPGLIVKIPVAEGDAVRKGQTILILESMKMQNELKAPIDGVVQTIHANEGSTVEKNALLITLGGDE